MKLEEINKIIEEYPVKNEIDKSIKDLLKTISQRSFEAGVNHGLDTVVKVRNEIPY
jgi:hypothetical protein